MSWREEIEPDWFHEAAFYLAAVIAPEKANKAGSTIRKAKAAAKLAEKES